MFELVLIVNKGLRNFPPYDEYTSGSSEFNKHRHSKAAKQNVREPSSCSINVGLLVTFK